MTLVYSNKKYRHTLFIDRLEEMVQLTLSDMMRQSILEYIPGWWERWFDNLSAGVMVECRDIPNTHLLFRQLWHYIDKAGMAVNEGAHGSVEFWRYALDNEEEEVANAKMTSCANDDEDDGLNDTCVCMFVVRKDEGIRGGNLHIYPNMQENYWSHMTGLTSERPLEMPLEIGNVVVMDGNLYHDISPCSGTGEMHIIIVKARSY